MTYDTTNRLTRISDANNNSISYQYDSLGNKTATITPTGATINYSYDAASHLTSIATSNGNYSFTYDAGGRRTKLSYPSNSYTSYSYDKNNNLTNIKQTSAANGTIADTPYSYDTVNNRITKQAITYNYDPLYQLISASGATPESYSYDALGNRQGGYQHNAANQTLSSPQGNYSYDQNGNQTSRGTWTQTWNSDNQLITTTNGTVTVIFKYDPFGRRIEKTTIDPGGSTTYRYLYDGPNIIQETRTTATATETTTYLHGPNIDEPLGMERNGQNYYFHQDGLGSIIAITDASGQKVQSYSYDSFGNITAQQNTTFIQPFAYTGRIWDAEIGLYDYRLRTYDPVLGKFISKDPLSFAAGDVNLYRYVGNGSPNYTDPWGLMPMIAAPLYYAEAKILAIGTAYFGIKTATNAMSASGLATKNQACQAQSAANSAIKNVVGINVAGTPLAMGPGLATYYGPSMYTAGMVVAGSPGGQRILGELPDFVENYVTPAPPTKIGWGALTGWVVGGAPTGGEETR